MNNDFEKTWNDYTATWKLETKEEKEKAFESCLDKKCVYNDPLVSAEGWHDLSEYMVEFHQQVPGGYFQTHYFLAHNQQSIAKWEMKMGDGTTIGEGVSYGRYSESGKLIAMTGFFES